MNSSSPAKVLRNVSQFFLRPRQMPEASSAVGGQYLAAWGSRGSDYIPDGCRCICDRNLPKFTEFPAESLVAGIVLTARTPAIAAPVAETFGDFFQARITDDIDRPALAHGQVMRGIKRLGGNIAKGSGKARLPIGKV